ncbi:hypothetical protein [Kribbella sp. NPDC000426]|uniref:hypothetical protein n=1 Tax=Kribbella sp. NPDC000426 TaxID=3154255 RepID=UPI003330D699
MISGTSEPAFRPARRVRRRTVFAALATAAVMTAASLQTAPAARADVPVGPILGVAEQVIP